MPNYRQAQSGPLAGLGDSLISVLLQQGRQLPIRGPLPAVCEGEYSAVTLTAQREEHHATPHRLYRVGDQPQQHTLKEGDISLDE